MRLYQGLGKSLQRSVSHWLKNRPQDHEEMIHLCVTIVINNKRASWVLLETNPSTSTRYGVLLEFTLNVSCIPKRLRVVLLAWAEVCHDLCFGLLLAFSCFQGKIKEWDARKQISLGLSSPFKPQLRVQAIGSYGPSPSRFCPSSQPLPLHASGSRAILQGLARGSSLLWDPPWRSSQHPAASPPLLCAPGEAGLHLREKMSIPSVQSSWLALGCSIRLC